jgi:hypothetical protein
MDRRRLDLPRPAGPYDQALHDALDYVFSRYEPLRT